MTCKLISMTTLQIKSRKVNKNTNFFGLFTNIMHYIFSPFLTRNTYKPQQHQRKLLKKVTAGQTTW